MAACAVSKVLSSNDVKHGFFGTYEEYETEKDSRKEQNVIPSTYQADCSHELFSPQASHTFPLQVFNPTDARRITPVPYAAENILHFRSSRPRHPVASERHNSQETNLNYWLCEAVGAQVARSGACELVI